MGIAEGNAKWINGRASADAFEQGKARWLAAVKAACASGAKYTKAFDDVKNETTVMLEDVTPGHGPALSAVGFARIHPESNLWVCSAPTMPGAPPPQRGNRASRRRASDVLRIK